MNLRLGVRLQSTACETSVVVIRAVASDDVAIRFAGHPMSFAGERFEPRARHHRAAGDPLLGKRYVGAEGSLELLWVSALRLQVCDSVVEMVADFAEYPLAFTPSEAQAASELVDTSISTTDGLAGARHHADTLEAVQRGVHRSLGRGPIFAPAPLVLLSPLVDLL
jgi:hypothetical protein